MGNNRMVYDLFKFIKEDVTKEKLFEAESKAYPVEEGKLLDDPSTIKDPKGDIVKLSEKETQAKAEKDADAAVNKDIKTANSGKTEEPEKTNIQKDAEKDNPTDKLTQDKKGQDPTVTDAMKKAKEEKKIEPKVTGVKKNEAKMTVEELAKELGVSVDVVKAIQDALRDDMKNEGKLQDDPSEVTGAKDEIQKLSEEKVLTTVSDENVAKDIAGKYPGSRVVTDRAPDGKAQFIVMVKEAKISEANGTPIYLRDLSEEVQAEILRDNPKVKEMNATDKDIVVGYFAPEPKLAEAKKVKEDVEATIKVDGKEINVTATDGGIQATSVDTAKSDQPIDRVETGIEEIPELEELPEEGEEMKEEEAGEMAEKIFILRHLKGLKSLTEKQQKFVNEVKAYKIGKKNKQKVGKALSQLKKKHESKIVEALSPLIKQASAIIRQYRWATLPVNIYGKTILLVNANPGSDGGLMYFDDQGMQNMINGFEKSGKDVDGFGPDKYAKHLNI